MLTLTKRCTSTKLYQVCSGREVGGSHTVRVANKAMPPRYERNHCTVFQCSTTRDENREEGRGGGERRDVICALLCEKMLLLLLLLLLLTPLCSYSYSYSCSYSWCGVCIYFGFRVSYVYFLVSSFPSHPYPYAHSHPPSLSSYQRRIYESSRSDRLP